MQRAPRKQQRPDGPAPTRASGCAWSPRECSNVRNLTPGTFREGSGRCRKLPKRSRTFPDVSGNLPSSVTGAVSAQHGRRQRSARGRPPCCLAGLGAPRGAAGAPRLCIDRSAPRRLLPRMRLCVHASERAGGRAAAAAARVCECASACVRVFSRRERERPSERRAHIADRRAELLCQLDHLLQEHPQAHALARARTHTRAPARAHAGNDPRSRGGRAWCSSTSM